MIEVNSFVAPVAVILFGSLITLLGFLFKNSLFKKIDSLEQKIEKIVEDNHRSHKEMWKEMGSVRERISKLEERVRIKNGS